MIPKNFDKSKIPHKPGVYIYKDIKGKVLYVGKAIDLYHRISSYWNKTNQSTKVLQLINLIRHIDTIIVQSELEALILEANLIKKHLPPFNIRLTDDKDYLYIKVTKETFPKIITARKKDLKDAYQYFGPFPSATTVKSTLKQLRRLFPWCQSTSSKWQVINDAKRRQRACFYYHLKLCPGPCVGQISQIEYKKIINRFCKFMGGKKCELMVDLGQDMIIASKNLEFEKAAYIKKILDGINYLTQPNKVAKYLENPNFLADTNKLALRQLKEDLKLKDLPERIEGYDISNIQGQNATGSMVVLQYGEVEKSSYRKFKIKISGKPNDYAMHQEMMRRRLNHPEWGIPQLIIIDGGRGQVRAVYKVISAFLSKTNKQYSASEKYHNFLLQAKQISIFGLAKRQEWIYPVDGEIIKLPKRSLSLKLLQKIRDEAHRFAISYHKKLRQKNMLIEYN